MYTNYVNTQAIIQVYKKLGRSHPLTATFVKTSVGRTAAGKFVQDSLGDVENPLDGKKKTRPPVVEGD